MIRILLLVDCANDFDRNLLRGIVRYSRENGPWLFYRLPSYYRSIENGERSILEWAKAWKADAIIGQWNDDAMDLLKEHGILFGTSICYTRDNIEAVTSDEFMRFLCDKGAHFGFYFHYMPVGNEAAPELMPSPEQRKYMIQRIRYLRSEACDIPFYPMDFQNDGEFVGGCIAGGRNYFHINSAGDAEPCVFIHYSNANIHDSSILEILQSPLFMAYHNGQPFNKNHLRPCPMLENPELLRKMVHETGAHSTDLQSPESVDHLCDKCKSYAANWQPTADEIWSHTKIRESRYENYKDWKPNQQ